jgi:outer membrane protein insertion porin family
MKPKRDILFFLRKNYKEFQADNDILRIKTLYLNNGFRNINVNIKKEYISKKNRFNLYFYIEEGIKYEFNNIDLSNNLLNISDDQKEYIKFILKDYRNSQIKNNIYNESHILNIKSQISDYLFNQGSKFFKISILEQINDDKVDIRYDINPIEPKYVNIINIFGNTRTLDKVVRRELRFAEGDPLNPELITSATKDLQRLNIFKNIEIKENFFNDEKSNIDIHLEEKPTGDFSVGASFASIEGAVFVASLKENNIGGTGRSVSFNINTSDLNTLYSFDVKEPYFDNKNMHLIYGLKYINNDYSQTSSYNLNSINSNIGVQYEFIDNLLHNISLAYELDNYEITDSSAVSSSILSSEGTNSVIKISNLLQYNKLNSFLRPTDGYLIRLNSILSPITNLSDGYIKNVITGKKFIKLNKNIVSIQSKLGNITSLQNDTVVENNKFSLGGRWLRGFDNYGAGPRNSRTSYVGGNNLFVSKIDISRPLYSNTDNPIDVYFFTDFGTVYGNKNKPTFSDSAVRSSYGYGIKFYTPIGPIGFSWAFPISDETYDIKRMFLFSVGNLN